MEQWQEEILSFCLVDGRTRESHVRGLGTHALDRHCSPLSPLLLYKRYLSVPSYAWDFYQSLLRKTIGSVAACPSTYV